MSQSAVKQDRKGTRAHILSAARQELIDGNGDLEVAKVARRAGVSAGLTYYHFDNKSGLLNALVSDHCAAMDDQILAVPFAGATWAEREKARVYCMVEYFYSDPVALLIATRLRTDPAFAAEEAERNRRTNLMGARNIAQAQRDGEIDPARDPLLLVSMILAGVTEGVRTALSTQPPKPLAVAQAEIWTYVAMAAGVTIVR